jgi:iron complex outermembrane receptor protein
MNSNTKLSCAIAAILMGGASGTAYGQTTPPPAAADTYELQTITVTAQRRSESIQDVPISIQAFTQQTMKELHIETFDDYIKYLPNVTSASNGPGQNEIFMRGLSAGVQASQGSGSTGLFPNVAIYLDDQSGQLPNRNLDIYAADLERIEVLEGPQGTLFGAGAQAGTVRYITNKPKLNVTEGNFDAGYGVTAHGDPNTNITAVINLPLIPDTLAARAVIYNDSRGGYIDNVPGTFTRRATDIGMYFANNGGAVPAGAPVINNNQIAARAINPVVYKGGRLEALWQINDDWNFLLSQMYQNMEAKGVFYQTPTSSDGVPLAPLETTLFNNAYDRDRFENTAWTVNGRLGALRAVYTGGYLVRHVDQVGDYTNYARGHYADYYQCFGPGTGGDLSLTPTCFSPSATWRTVERNEHAQHEIRLSTPDDWRFRGIVGAYYENNKLFDQTAWQYKTVPTCTSNAAPGTPGNGNTGCFTNVGTFVGTSVENPGIQNDNTSFYQDTRRATKQTAFFASFDFDLIPKVLTLTAGSRHFVFKNSSAGSVTSSFGCFEQGVKPNGCLSAFSYNLDTQNLSNSESGYKSRVNVTWHITPDAMVYYTYSQGFRPGGFNQSGGAAHAIGPDKQPQYLTPSSFVSDSLTNNEIGWKTEFWNHRLQWNGAIYQENWSNVQLSLFDPGLVGNIFFNTNGQNFRVRGLETSLVARVTDGLTLQGAASWNQSRQTNSPALIDNNPSSANVGKPITQQCNANGLNCVGITNPFGPVGAPSANAPPVQFSLRARYEWNLNDYKAFVQAAATHTGHSYTQAGANPPLLAGGAISTARLRFEDPAYTTYDASIGVAKDAWNTSIYAQNLTNQNASVFTNTDQFIVAQTVLRPRVIGLAVGYKF